MSVTLTSPCWWSKWKQPTKSAWFLTILYSVSINKLHPVTDQSELFRLNAVLLCDAGGGDYRQGIGYDSWHWRSDPHGAGNHTRDHRDASPDPGVCGLSGQRWDGTGLSFIPSQPLITAWFQPGSVFSDQTSVWFPCDETEEQPEAKARVEEKAKRIHRHVFLSKTVQTLRSSRAHTQTHTWQWT